MAKPLPPKPCQICGSPTASARRRVCDNPDCIRENKRRGSERHERKERKERHGQELERSPVVCGVCGERLLLLATTHLKKHGLTFDEYRERFPDAPIMVDSVRQSRGDGSKRRAQYLTYEAKEPDNQLFAFLTGSLLGDGSLECRDRNARYAEGASNEKYLFWKHELLRQYFPCTWRERVSKPHARTGKSYRGWWLRTASHPLLTEWHSKRYAPYKIVPFDIVERFITPFALAIWFCDDGNAGNKGSNYAYLYTMAFTEKETKQLIELLKERFSVLGTYLTNKHGKPFIGFNSKSKDLLQSIIAPFRLPGMEYKYGAKDSNDTGN
jgi:LAGLIDADG DNA endonuclease family